MKELSPEQVAKMRPEARERYEERLRIVKRNRKILGIFCAVLAGALILLVLSLTILFNITSINVSKKSAFYSEQEIIIASGLDAGDNMLRTDFDKVCDRIEKNLPYILEATVTKKLSGAVTINVKDTTAAMLFESNQGYALADINGKVLEIIKEIPEDAKFMVIKADCELDAVPGEKFAFREEKANGETKGVNEKLYDSIIKELKAADMLKNITLIDISNRSSITLEYQNRLRLLLGANEQLDIKLKSAAETIKAEDSKDPTTIAEVNLTIPKKVFVNSIDSLDEPEEDIDDTIASTDTSDSENSNSMSSEGSTEKMSKTDENNENNTVMTSENTSNTQ